MDFTQLRSFVMLARELHFGRAAQKLNITQPPLSRQIKRLEDTLGVMLFLRTSHSVALTAAGRQILPEAIEIIQRCVDLSDTAKRTQDTKSGILKLGFIGASAFHFMPQLLKRAAHELPNIEVSLIELTAIQQVNALGMGEIDLGLIRPITPNAQLGTETVWTEPLVVAVPIQNPVARRPRIALSEIAHEPFIMFHETAPYMHRVLNEVFAQAQIFPPVVQRLAHAQAILSLVSVDMGLAIVPGDAQNMSFENVVFRPLVFDAPIQAELNMIWRNDTRNPAVHLFKDIASTIGHEGMLS